MGRVAWIGNAATLKLVLGILLEARLLGVDNLQMPLLCPCSFVCECGPPCALFGFCRFLSLSGVASPPPRSVPCGALAQLFTLVPPSGYLVAAVTARLPCFCAGSVVVLCRPSVICLMATKASKPCVGFFSPSPPCCRELSLASLRYSSG